MSKEREDENVVIQFKEGTRIEQVEDFLLELIRDKEKYVFRGESQKNEIYPAIMRHGLLKNAEDEWELLRKFERYGANYYHVYGAIDFLACAQHYGLPTRLLDFTYNPFVALAFALRADQPHDGYYIIRYCRLEDNVTVDSLLRSSGEIILENNVYRTLTDQTVTLLSNIDRRRKQDYKKVINKVSQGENTSVEESIIVPENDMSDKLIFVETVQSNERIIVQQGLFMLAMDLEKDKYL